MGKVPIISVLSLSILSETAMRAIGELLRGQYVGLESQITELQIQISNLVLILSIRMAPHYTGGIRRTT